MSPVREAMVRVAARPRLLVAVVALHLLVGIVASEPLSAALAPHLDARPAAARMVRGEDALAIELAVDHPELGRIAASSALWSFVIYALLSSVLAGGLLVAYAKPAVEPAPIARVLQAAAEHAWTMLSVGAWGLGVRLVPLLAGGGLAWACYPLIRDQSFQLLLASTIAALVVFGALWSLGTVALDGARGIAIADRRVAARAALSCSLRRLLARPGACVRVAALSGLGFAAATALYLLIALRVESGLVLALARLGVVFARAFFSLATLVAASRVLTAERPRSA